MKISFKIFSSVILAAFLCAAIMCCCWQKIASEHFSAKVAQPSCHTQPASEDSQGSQKSCECPQIISIIIEKNHLVLPGDGYLKWLFESPVNEKTITFFSYPSTEPSMLGPPSRYVFLTPDYLKNTHLRI